MIGAAGASRKEQSRKTARLAPAEFLGHPIGLSFLFGTEMWERFSYYGMRAILTFYMVDYLFRDDTPRTVIGYDTIKRGFEWFAGPLGPQPLASMVYGAYTALVYLTPLIGGAIADRLIGQRRAVVIGALTMAAGEAMLTQPSLFFLGLLTMIVGNGFFKPNISTQVAGLYQPGDARVDRAYSIFYVGVNIGGLLAPIVCGGLGHSAPGEAPHWYLGYAAAGIGMVCGLMIYLLGQRHLPPDIRARREQSANASGPLSGDEWRVVAALIAIAFFNLFFWACFEQQGITIALLAQDNVDLSTPLGTLQPEYVQSINGIFIFLLTPVVVALWARQARTAREPASVTKMAIGCGLAACSFALLAVIGGLVDAGGRPGLWWLVVSIAVLTMGELYLSPVGLSLFAKAAPPQIASLMMGVFYLSNFAGNYMAGYLGSFWEAMPKQEFFTLVAGIAAAAAVAIFCVGRVIRPMLLGREGVLQAATAPSPTLRPRPGVGTG